LVLAGRAALNPSIKRNASAQTQPAFPLRFFAASASPRSRLFLYF
jgi:hypothetical protein